MGQQATAAGNSSVSLGYLNRSFNLGSIALGSSNSAAGQTSIAIGDSNNSQGISSVAIGKNITLTTAANYSFGVNLNGSAMTVSKPNTMAIVGGNVGIGTADANANLEVYGTVSMMGTFDATSYTTGTSYKANTDGFVSAFWTSGTGSASGGLDGLTDSANPPTHMMATTRVNGTGGLTNGTVFMPVKKGDYWKIVVNGSAATITVNWIPLGQ
jgi:hypothetical protein